MNKNNNLTVDQIFNLAFKYHKENNLNGAAELYNQILKINPNHSFALNNLGLIFNQLGENEKAKIYFEKAIITDSNYADPHNNLGIIFQDLGENKKAKDCYEKAIEINPRNAHSHNNLGTLFADLDGHQKAKDYFEKAIETEPNFSDAHNNLGNLFKKIDEPKKALDCYEKAIEINPDNAKVHFNLGVIFLDLGEYQKATDCYEKAIEINPGYADAYNNLGSAFSDLGEYQKASDCYEKVIEIDPNNLGGHANITTLYIRTLDNLDKAITSSYNALKIHHKNSKFPYQSVPLFRLKHDVQQAQYLISKDYKLEGIKEFQKIGNEILNREENKEDKNNYNKKILLTPNEIDTLLPFYKSDHTYEPKKISGSCINPNKNWQDVEDEYFKSSNQIMYIDDFLSDEAIKELREFCLVSKIWNKEYQHKYLGAISDQGFISPIHLQIAIELKKQLPKLFGPHEIEKFWGFKYDATLGKGINIHADFAIHNLNFWITPDEYNNDKNSGGLKVYDVPAPDDWTFKDYNAKHKNIYEFLKDNNANCTNIPYKFNRAVLFNSAYFHETDKIDFKDEYEGRRINNTYLFGKRLVKKQD